jgi:hypothetical protein
MISFCDPALCPPVARAGPPVTRANQEMVTIQSNATTNNIKEKMAIDLEQATSLFISNHLNSSKQIDEMIPHERYGFKSKNIDLFESSIGSLSPYSPPWIPQVSLSSSQSHERIACCL